MVNVLEQSTSPDPLLKVLGWSDGGIIEMVLTIHHPDKVAMLAMLGANLEPQAAYPRAIDSIVRVRKRIESKLEGKAPSKNVKLALEPLDLLGTQPHITLADLARISVRGSACGGHLLRDGTEVGVGEARLGVRHSGFAAVSWRF